MSGKLNKIKLREEFMAMWWEEQTLWAVMFPLYPRMIVPDKNEKEKSLKRMSDKFQIFWEWYRNFIFQFTPEILKFQLCF